MEQKPISAFHEILKWSVSRPDWQRDALRRIIVKGTLDGNDIQELTGLCRSKHGIAPAAGTSTKAEFLDKAHIQPEISSEASVTLLSIGKLQNVNRLPSDQVISFGIGPGVTIIYGDNGTGKSGYARVIKKACRTRGAPPEIRPNVFESVSNDPPIGTLVCRISDTDYSLKWQDGMPSDPRLANVFVFDTSTADHYLEKDSPAIFTPSGLDVLPKLSKVCDTISQLVKNDLDCITADIESTHTSWKFNANTSVGKFLNRLSAEIMPSHVDFYSGLDEKQSKRLKDLTEALKSEPKQKAKESRAAAARLRQFAELITDAHVNFSADQVSALRKLVETAKATDEVAKSFAAGSFDASYLTGTGNELWRTLWEAARLFSVSLAYKDQVFPVTDGGARCVLCQQNLEPPAIKRLQVFDAFCKDQSQELAKAARKRLKDASDKIQKINTLGPEYIKVEADLVPVTQAQMTTIPNEKNIQSMRRAYSWLRATMERVVEKEVFADVVFRYRSYVDIKKLDGVVGFSGNECKELQRIVQRCHDVTDAHDPAPGKQAAVPEPNELERDLVAAKKLLEEIRARRKKEKSISGT